MGEPVVSQGATRGASAGFTAAPARADSKAAGRSARRVTPGASHRFVAATDQLGSGTPVVSVMGEVDLATARALERTLLSAADRTGELIVDLSSCSFLDSRGLGALIVAWEHLDRSNRPLAVVISNPNVLRVFQITGFDELLEIYPSLAAAVNGNGNGHV